MTTATTKTNGAAKATVSKLDKVVPVLRQVRGDLLRRVIEQDTAIDLIMCALISGEHIALVGPPGEAKSVLGEGVADYVGGERYYHLLTRYTVPSEIFGQYSLPELQKGHYVRLTDETASKARITFLDEIFKANSPTLNSLLGYLNERTVSKVPFRCPMRTCVGASNEYPRGIDKAGRDGDDESLRALWDRFLFRCEIVSPTSDESFVRLITGDFQKQASPALVGIMNADILSDIDSLMKDALRKENISSAVVSAFRELRASIRSFQIVVSSRRWCKAIIACAAHALLNGRDRIAPSDLRILRHVLWTVPDDRNDVAEAVISSCAPEVAAALALEEKFYTIISSLDLTTGTERRSKLVDTINQLEAISNMLDDLQSTDEEVVRIDAVIRKRGESLQTELVGSMKF